MVDRGHKYSSGMSEAAFWVESHGNDSDTQHATSWMENKSNGADCGPRTAPSPDHIVPEAMDVPLTRLTGHGDGGINEVDSESFTNATNPTTVDGDREQHDVYDDVDRAHVVPTIDAPTIDIGRVPAVNVDVGGTVGTSTVDERTLASQSIARAERLVTELIEAHKVLRTEVEAVDTDRLEATTAAATADRRFNIQATALSRAVRDWRQLSLLNQALQRELDNRNGIVQDLSNQ